MTTVINPVRLTRFVPAIKIGAAFEDTIGVVFYDSKVAPNPRFLIRVSFDSGLVFSAKDFIHLTGYHGNSLFDDLFRRLKQNMPIGKIIVRAKQSGGASFWGVESWSITKPNPYGELYNPPNNKTYGLF